MGGLLHRRGSAWRFVIPALVALAPLHAAGESAPAPAGSCDEQLAAIDKKFEPVLKKKGNDECTTNNFDANVDKLPPLMMKTQGKECTQEDVSICRATYKQLQLSVQKYKDDFKAGCEKSLAVGKDCVKSADTDGQKKYYQCMAKEAREAAAAEEKAAKSMQAAIDDAKKYQKLAEEAAAKYRSDARAIHALCGIDYDPGTCNEAKGIRGGALVTDPGILDSIQARNGGRETLLDYSRNTGRLAFEEDGAVDTSKVFLKTGATEVQDRQTAALNLNQIAASNDRLSTGMGAPPPDKSGDTTKGSPTITGKSDSNNNLLSAAAPMAGLATAGAGLAKTMGGTGASQMNPGPTGGSLEGGATAPTPDSFNTGSRGLASNTLGGDLLPLKGTGTTTAPGDPVAGTGGGFLAPGGLSGHTGGAHPGGGFGDLTPTDGAGGMKLNSAFASGASSAPAGGGASLKGFGGSSADKKDSPDAPCTGADCAAMAEVKSTQFNGGGSLGVPHIGAPDPAFATAGALDNLFGPLSNVDPNAAIKSPSDPSKSGGGMLDGMLGLGAPAAVDADGNAGSVQAGGNTPVAAAETRSLFARVHDVHEAAVKKGALSLYHKKL